MDPRLIGLALGGFAMGVEGFSFPAFLPGIGAETGASLAQAGYVAFGYAMANVFGPPVLLAIFGAADRRLLVGSAAIVFAACALLLAVVPGLPAVILARVLLGVGAGLYAAVAQSTAVALAPPERSGQAVGIVLTGSTLAVAIGAPLGAWVAGTYGWRLSYAGIGVLGLIATAIVWSMLPAGIMGERQSLKERLSVLAVPGVVFGMATTALFMTGQFSFLTYLAPVAISSGVDASLLPLVLLAFGLGSLVGPALGGRLADRLGARRASTVEVAGAMAVLGGVWVAPLLPAAVAGPLFFVLTAASGTFGWGYVAAHQPLMAAAAPSAVPLALALNLTAINIGVGFSAIIGGLVIERLGVGLIGLVGAVFAAAALAVVLVSPLGPGERVPAQA